MLQTLDNNTLKLMNLPTAYGKTSKLFLKDCFFFRNRKIFIQMTVNTHSE